jgi:nucleotide-binding universal stress UspA family protein
VAFNDTPESEAALAAARSMAARLRASVQALTVVGLAAAGPGARGALDVGWEGGIEIIEQAARDRLRSLDGVGRVAFGRPGDELVAFGDEIDPLVVGSRSFGPLRRLTLGSTSMHLARDVRNPLLVLPRPAIVSDARDQS